MKQVFIKPNGNLICRHPESNAVLPQDGGYWPDSAHTRRALRAGDVIAATPPEEKTAPTAEAATEKAPAKTRAKRSKKEAK